MVLQIDEDPLPPCPAPASARAARPTSTCALRAAAALPLPALRAALRVPGLDAWRDYFSRRRAAARMTSAPEVGAPFSVVDGTALCSFPRGELVGMTRLVRQR